MNNHTVLDNVSHRTLKVDPKLSAEYGDNVNSICIYVTELLDIQAEYPVLFQKNKNTGSFILCAMLGFKENENLFLDKDSPLGWAGEYIPALLNKGPFLIGFQDQTAEGGNEKEAIIHIDTNNPRIKSDLGESIFLEHGGNSKYLTSVASSLNLIHDGIEKTAIMINEYQKLELIQPLNIDIVFDNNEKHIISGYYTLDAEKLASLSGDNLFQLNQKGFLSSAYQITTSMRNIKKLINIKNRKN